MAKHWLSGKERGEGKRKEKTEKETCKVKEKAIK